MGSGGLTGAGLGDGHQTLGYMPEAHSDFILAPIGEELGFDRRRRGAAAVRRSWCGAASARRSARATCSAATSRSASRCCSALQALFNVGVVLGIVPNKGITLPLVSYGGSSLVITMFLVGLLLNVGRRPERRAAASSSSASRSGTNASASRVVPA